MITPPWLATAYRTTTATARAIYGQAVLGLRILASRSGDLGRSLARAGTRAGAYVRSLRKLWLFMVEIAGVVLVTWGISFWSIPSAIIIGGIILIVAIELRPIPGPKFPEIPVPIEALRHQAEFAAEAINNERFGLAMVDPTAFENLTSDDCEKIITLARSIGAKRT